MADSEAQEDADSVASHTLALLRAPDRKMDLVLQTQARHTERLGRLASAPQFVVRGDPDQLLSGR
jgi:hypothetical protein